MKQRGLRLIVCAIAAFIAGCAQPCFYRAGKSLDECRHDLLECLRTPYPVLCMQTKGYQYQDSGKLPQSRERAKIVARSEKYWILAGVGMSPETQRVSSAREPRTNDVEMPEGRLVEYRVERGDLGTFKVTLVYQDDQRQ
jgi:hypothetical protein